MARSNAHNDHAATCWKILARSRIFAKVAVEHAFLADRIGSWLMEYLWGAGSLGGVTTSR